MLESVAEQTHVASRKRPSRRADETGLLGPKLQHEQLAVIVPIDRLENDFAIGRLHDCICRKMSRACSSLMRLTDVIRSANCASDDISAEPTSTSTAKIEKSNSALRSRSRASHSGLTCDSPSVIITMSPRLSFFWPSSSTAASIGVSKSVPPPG